MNRQTYCLLEDFMLFIMDDAAHDKEHIYRVLYSALEIAKTEKAWKIQAFHQLLTGIGLV